MKITRSIVAVTVVAATSITCGARESLDLSGTGWTANGNRVTIPHTWNAIDGADGGEPEYEESANAPSYAHGAVVYRRKLPPLAAGKRAFLRFQGASSKATVSVNGHEIGRHVGAYTAFVCEATPWMTDSGENELEVVVDNYVDCNVPPCAADFTVYGGLYRGVELVVTDRACIDPTYHAGPGVWVDADPATGRVTADVKLNGATATADVSCQVRDADGKVVAVGSPKSLQVSRPALWSPETPNLYTLTATMRDGTSEDCVSVRFGFRTVEFRADGFYLNGKKHKIRGVNRHQDRDGKGWALSPADEEEDIAFIKEIGADGLRTAHYPQSANLYDLCDEKGLLAWVESPNVNLVRDTDAYRANAVSNLTDAIWQLKNHPAIFVWSISNELSTNRAPKGVTERLMTELKGIVREIDETRPVALATCRSYQRDVNAIPDAIGFNFYPGWYRNVPEGMTGTIDAALADNPGVTTIGVTEYGAGASVFQHGDAQARNMPLTPVHIEEWQAWVHYWNYKALFADDRVWGSFVWVMFDFGADARREGLRHGINDKGLVTGDRCFRKDAFHFYKANWTTEPVLHLVGARMTETTNAFATVMGFSNVGTVRLVVNGRDMGIQTPDEVKTVVWRNVALADGRNEIRLESDSRSAAAVWMRVRPQERDWLQRKIDAAASSGGGTVVVPPGTHEFAPVVLKGGVTLRLEKGAVLLASTNLSEYVRRDGSPALIGAFDVADVAVEGEGVIDGRGFAFKDPEGLPGESQPIDVPVLMRFSRCRNVRLEDFTFRQAAAWGIHLRNSDGVVVRGVKAFSHVNNSNDGIDIESSNVLIEDCDLDTDDDALVFKSESDPSFSITNVLVRNCTLASCCNFIKFGTGSYGQWKDIRVENCRLRRAGASWRFDWRKRIPGVTERITGLAAIALEVVDGGQMENVTVRNISWDGGVQTPLFVRLDRRHEPPAGRRTFFRNVVVEDVCGDAESRLACSVTGVPDLNLSGLTLRNIELAFPGGGTDEEAESRIAEAVGEYPDNYMFGHAALPAWGIYFRHCDDVKLENVKLRLKPGAVDARPRIVTDDARIRLDNRLVDPDDRRGIVVTPSTPGMIRTNAAGRPVADFGKAAVGWLELRGLPEGEYEVVVGETTDTAGNVTNAYPESSIRCQRLCGRITAGNFRVPMEKYRLNMTGYDPKAPAILLPEWAGVVLPFRYVEIVKSPGSVTASNLVRRALHAPIDMAASSFVCDNAVLNDVYEFCKYSIWATSFCGIYVDGDRERTPYEADAYINQLGHYAIESDYAMARRTCEWLMTHGTWPTEWKQHQIMMNWTDWMWTGDTRPIARHWETLVREKSLLACARESDGLLLTGGERNQGCRIPGGGDIVDWPPGERDDFEIRPVNGVVNAFHYRNLHELSQMAQAVGRSKESAELMARAERVRTAFRAVFRNKQTGLFVDGEGSAHSSVHVNAAALAFGLADADEEERLVAFLEKKGLVCGIYFAQYLLEALCLSGRTDLAVRLMASDGERSWAGMMRFGSTVSMEAWNMKAKPNQDLTHAWGTAPLNVISRHVLGVTPLTPGFERISIAPCLGGLKWMKGVVPTRKGPVSIEATSGRLVVSTPAPARVVWQGRTHDIPPGNGVVIGF